MKKNYKVKLKDNLKKSDIVYAGGYDPNEFLDKDSIYIVEEIITDGYYYEHITLKKENGDSIDGLFNFNLFKIISKTIRIKKCCNNCFFLDYCSKNGGYQFSNKFDYAKDYCSKFQSKDV